MLLELGPSLPPIKAVLGNLPPGREGVSATLKIMARQARAGSKRLAVRLVALQLVEQLAQRDWLAEIRELHEFVRDRIRYVKDIRGVETLQEPERTLQLKQGDCDDKATLLAALLTSIGHPTRLHAVGFGPRGAFSHVYAETRTWVTDRLNGERRQKWIALETTEPWAMGRAPNAVSHLIIHVTR